MQVRARHATRGTHQADQFAALNFLPFGDVDLAQMTIHRNEALAVIEKHGVAVEE